MNFVPSRQGFYEEEQQQHQQRSWLENKFGDATAGGDDDRLSRQGGDDAVGDAGAGMDMVVVVEREHMFDKVVTPSDVGKLNRLVIPKQHAEKYFPLDSSTNEKGLLLNFEDRNGKPWRFRYSYWNSSQSYVMTKGWSRFVKEKKLDAGDIVSFQRGVGETAKDRLFIDWRRRPDAVVAPATDLLSHSTLPHHFSPFHHRGSIQPWISPSSLFLQQQQVSTMSARDRHSQLLLQQPSHSQYSSNNQHGGYSYSYGSGGGPYSSTTHGGSVIYFRSGAGAAVAQQQVGMTSMQVVQRGRVEPPMVFESVPVVQGKAAAKRLRLFGVNMECPISESDDDCDVILSSTSIQQPPHHHHHHHHHNTTSMAPHYPVPPPSPSSSSIPYLQLSPYSGSPIQALPASLINKGKSSMSLDLEI
ncbi:hypothetical protein RJ639_043053 [Escallonia herrerae]|uniref:TF-B3 domain-containing protein n=1 Tax=Escallonia herrerae TaxID=1293975 RepID=A0AA88WCK8_9ASTE|nr:hypothetical protein RJ639_043053 [Escallonia herrerae]